MQLQIGTLERHRIEHRADQRDLCRAILQAEVDRPRLGDILQRKQRTADELPGDRSRIVRPVRLSNDLCLIALIARATAIVMSALSFANRTRVWALSMRTSPIRVLLSERLASCSL
jgi:hypothetical protein